MAYRIINGITLCGVGLLLLAFFFTGRIDSYLHPQFRLGVLGGGLILIVCGLICALRKPLAGCCADEVCEQHKIRPLRSVTAFGVLLVPMVSASFFSKDGYDQRAILNRGFVQDATKLPIRSNLKDRTRNAIPSAALGGDVDGVASGQNSGASNASTGAPNVIKNPPTDDLGLPVDDEDGITKEADGILDVQVTDLLSGQSRANLRSMVEGKRVEVIGQYLPQEVAGEFNLVRMFIVCCAADARPIMVPVHGKTTVPEMSWVKVIGRAIYSGTGDKREVSLKADQVLATDPPADAMLY